MALEPLRYEVIVSFALYQGIKNGGMDYYLPSPAKQDIESTTNQYFHLRDIAKHDSLIFSCEKEDIKKLPYRLREQYTGPLEIKVIDVDKKDVNGVEIAERIYLKTERISEPWKRKI